jgi:hypothetical protein
MVIDEIPMDRATVLVGIIVPVSPFIYNSLNRDSRRSMDSLDGIDRGIIKESFSVDPIDSSSGATKGTRKESLDRQQPINTISYNKSLIGYPRLWRIRRRFKAPGGIVQLL